MPDDVMALIANGIHTCMLLNFLHFLRKTGLGHKHVCFQRLISFVRSTPTRLFLVISLSLLHL